MRTEPGASTEVDGALASFGEPRHAPTFLVPISADSEARLHHAVVPASRAETTIVAELPMLECLAELGSP
ncbi:MAG TPA: hypothetical protein VFU02_21440, partial [Polyangiaceae bacterium]|nr:hypothetical protein [Polyangiaceae bacterium]